MRAIKPYGSSDIIENQRQIQYNKRHQVKQRKQFPETQLKKSAHILEHLKDKKLKQRIFTSIVDHYTSKDISQKQTKALNRLKRLNNKEKEIKEIEDVRKAIVYLKACAFHHEYSPYKNEKDKDAILDFLGSEDLKEVATGITNYNQAVNQYLEVIKNDIKPENIFPQYYAKVHPFSSLKKHKEIVEKFIYEYQQKVKGITGSINNSASPFTQDFNQTMHSYYFNQWLQAGQWADVNLHPKVKDYPLEDLLNDILAEVNRSKSKKYHYKSIAPIINKFHNNIKCSKHCTNNPDNMNSQLFFYKNMVIEALKMYFPNNATFKCKNFNFDKELTVENIQQKIEHKIRNKIISQFIRMGKFIFYATEDKPELNYTAAQEAIQNNPFDSHLQHDIKQKESFARNNLSAVSFASMSLKNIVDNNGSVGNDLLTNKGWSDPNRKFYLEQFKLYFGEKYTKDDAEKLINALRDYLRDIRNKLFHFKGVETCDIFNIAVEESLHALIKTIINEDKNQHNELLIKELQALNIHLSSWKDHDNINILLTEYFQTRAANLTLPNFHKLLKRTQNFTDHLPKPLESTADNNSDDNLRHALFKHLYENGFSHWVLKQNENHYQGWINQAKDRTREDSKNKKEDVRVNDIPDYNNKDYKNIAEYFAELNHLAAIQNHTQQKDNRYSQNKDQTQKNSNFVRNFTIDFFAFAFQDYLKKKSLKELHKISFNMESKVIFKDWFENININSNPVNINLNEDYYGFYLYLHLLNGDHLNHVSMQLIKLTALLIKEKKKRGKEEEKNKIQGKINNIQILLEIVNFYLKIKDCKLMNIYAQDDFWKEFYHKDFEAQDDSFKQQAGFIELARFIGKKKILEIFNKDKRAASNLKIPPNRQDELLEKYKTSKQEIIDQQKNMSKIHQTLVEEKSLNEGHVDDYNNYRKYVTKLDEYRHLRNRITCRYPIKLHQLMIAIAGRLVGYTNILERDLYFYLIGVNYYFRSQLEPTINNLYNRKRNKVLKGQNIPLWRSLKEELDKNTEHYQALRFFEQGWTSSNEIFNIRNNIMHFNYLISENTSINFTSFMNDIRKTVSYDRKLKNAVSKSIIGLFDKNNITIGFSMPNHQLELKTIEAKEITHIKNAKWKFKNKDKDKPNPIKLPSEHEHYINLLYNLFGKVAPKKPYKNKKQQYHKNNRQNRNSRQPSKATA